MFNRTTLVLIAAFAATLFVLVTFWQEAPGIELYSDKPVIKAHRISQDLGGKWDGYSSLRQAWAQENNAESIVLPSDQRFQVAVKKFSVTGKWGFKTAQLAIEGLYGNARVFLNGIDEVNFLGEYEGSGGITTIDIHTARLDFSRENTLYLELSPAKAQQKKIFSWLWPEQGRITGQIRLEAVPETSINAAETTVSYDTAKKQAIVRLTIDHHQFLEYGPWALSGVIKDNNEIVAECLLPLNSDGEYKQQVDLVFNLPDPKLWSLENPFRYELNLLLSNNRGDFDSIQMPIGFRQMNSTTDKWVLNGKEIPVKGEILNQEQAAGIRNQRQVASYLEEIKNKGKNVVYFMGFFPDEGWLYAADQLGIGVWLELPASLIAKSKDPYDTEMEELILISERHPSVLAWTAGKGLEPSAEVTDYLLKIRDRLANLPVYHLAYFPAEDLLSNSENIIIEANQLQGQWGRVERLNDSSQIKNKIELRSLQIFLICWSLWLLLISFQNVRTVGWKYRELFNPSPKRSTRRAFFWGTLAMLSRMATVGVFITFLLFRIPLQLFYWLPYHQTPLHALQNQSPPLIWLFISFSLILVRLFQVGFASCSFPEKPGALALSCWLERRYIWVFLVGIAFVVAINYGEYWYIPAVLYVFMTTLLFPFRIRDVWKAGGKYSTLLFVPISLAFVGVFALLWHHEDSLYLVRMVLPHIHFSLPQLFS